MSYDQFLRREEKKSESPERKKGTSTEQKDAAAEEQASAEGFALLVEESDKKVSSTQVTNKRLQELSEWGRLIGDSARHQKINDMVRDLMSRSPEQGHELSVDQRHLILQTAFDRAVKDNVNSIFQFLKDYCPEAMDEQEQEMARKAVSALLEKQSSGLAGRLAGFVEGKYGVDLLSRRNVE